MEDDIEKDENKPRGLDEVQLDPSPSKDYWYFWGPSLVNLVVALLGFQLIGLPGLVPASIFIVVGVFWAILKNRKQGLYMLLSGVVAWLIGFSVCGIILLSIK